MRSGGSDEGLGVVAVLLRVFRGSFFFCGQQRLLFRVFIGVVGFGHDRTPCGGEGKSCDFILLR